MQAARAKATYQDILNLPEAKTGEVVSGELFVSPRPPIRHARSASAIGGRLMGPFNDGDGGPGGWWILDEPELHFNQDVVVPDLAGWRRDRMSQLPDASYISQAPQWICEVLSPSTTRIDRVIKMPIYVREGVEHAWLVEPERRTVEVFALSEDRWTLLRTFSDDDAMRASPFDAIDINLAGWWMPE